MLSILVDPTARRAVPASSIPLVVQTDRHRLAMPQHATMYLQVGALPPVPGSVLRIGPVHATFHPPATYDPLDAGHVLIAATPAEQSAAIASYFNATATFTGITANDQHPYVWLAYARGAADRPLVFGPDPQVLDPAGVPLTAADDRVWVLAVGEPDFLAARARPRWSLDAHLHLGEGMPDGEPVGVLVHGLAYEDSLLRYELGPACRARLGFDLVPPALAAPYPALEAWRDFALALAEQPAAPKLLAVGTLRVLNAALPPLATAVRATAVAVAYAPDALAPYTVPDGGPVAFLTSSRVKPTVRGGVEYLAAYVPCGGDPHEYAGESEAAQGTLAVRRPDGTYWPIGQSLQHAAPSVPACGNVFILPVPLAEDGERASYDVCMVWLPPFSNAYRPLEHGTFEGCDSDAWELAGMLPHVSPGGPPSFEVAAAPGHAWTGTCAAAVQTPDPGQYGPYTLTVALPPTPLPGAGPYRAGLHARLWPGVLAGGVASVIAAGPGIAVAAAPAVQLTMDYVFVYADFTAAGAGPLSLSLEVAGLVSLSGSGLLLDSVVVMPTPEARAGCVTFEVVDDCPPGGERLTFLFQNSLGMPETFHARLVSAEVGRETRRAAPMPALTEGWRHDSRPHGERDVSVRSPQRREAETYPLPPAHRPNWEDFVGSETVLLQEGEGWVPVLLDAGDYPLPAEGEAPRYIFGFTIINYLVSSR